MSRLLTPVVMAKGRFSKEGVCADCHALISHLSSGDIGG